MSVNLPIGPLQISYTGEGVNTTGTIQVNPPPAGSPAGPPPSLVLGAAGNPATNTQAATATTSATDMTLHAGWQVETAAGRYSFSFTGNFTSRLQGTGTLITVGGTGRISQVWRAQLGETNVPFYLNGALVGNITIAGTTVTFNFTSGDTPITASVAPDTGLHWQMIDPSSGLRQRVIYQFEEAGQRELGVEHEQLTKAAHRPCCVCVPRATSVALSSNGSNYRLAVSP